VKSNKAERLALAFAAALVPGTVVAAVFLDELGIRIFGMIAIITLGGLVILALATPNKG